MGELFGLWLWPLLALLLLPGILVYFGLHVVSRGVIFVDLALAQVAAFGVCMAVVLGAEPGTSYLPEVLSFLFTLVGAALFSWTRFRHPRVPQEAIIGIIYVVAAAAATVVLSRSAEGDETIKNLLVGNILLVNRAEVLRTALLYALVGAVHWLLRDRFLGLTFEPDKALEAGVRIRAWDFAFYASFGLVVTSFVRIAGVYLVFSYLIVPAVCAALLAEGIRARLWIGWILAFLAGVTGLVLSVQLEELDLPTGPTIVCVFGGLLVVSGAIAYARHRAGAKTSVPRKP
jgi:zinc/manganese transport system permease protein